MCGRFTIDCGIPPIQNTQIDHAEVARCTLSVSSLTDLDYCVAFVNWVGVFLEHVHKTLKTSELLTPNFLVVSLYIACLLVLVASTTPTATFTSNRNRSQASWLQNQFSVQFSESCFWIKNESVSGYNSQPLFANNIHKDCLYIKNQLNARRLNAWLIYIQNSNIILFSPQTPVNLKIGQVIDVDMIMYSSTWVMAMPYFQDHPWTASQKIPTLRFLSRQETRNLSPLILFTNYFHVNVPDPNHICNTDNQQSFNSVGYKHVKETKLLVSSFQHCSDLEILSWCVKLNNGYHHVNEKFERFWSV